MKEKSLVRKYCPFGLALSVALQIAVAQESASNADRSFTLPELVSEA
jgi:hypothetical protein